MSKFDDFIVEIGTEELPPRELQPLVTSLAELLTQQLTAAGVSFASFKTFATPRRLAVLITELAKQQPEQTISKRGPAIAAAYNADGTPTKAALGFANSCGVSMQDLTTQETDKGAWLYFEQTVTGQDTTTLLPSMLEKSLAQLPIKKYMRWGNGELSFVRPVHWVLMLYGKEIINANVFNITASNHSFGHRIHAPKAIKIATPNTYEQHLENHGWVIADFTKRKQVILDAIKKLAATVNASPIVPDELLNMVTGLVEYPCPLLAEFNPDFLRVPKECLISSMQDHQKCFALADKDGNLLPKFILISNIASTSPPTVIHGNQLVMNARLADAAFYFDKDQKQPLESRVEQLKTVTYLKKLGSLHDKTIRIQKLAAYIAAQINADQKTTERAAYLCKADLLTSMVYEFPELQGVMGCYYAKHDQEANSVAVAIQEHYQPRFATDILPDSAPGICIALADRIDSLVGMFGIGNIPTGEKDPYALRRQTLAVLRIIIEKQLDLDLIVIFKQALNNYSVSLTDPTQDLLAFCFDRLKAWYLAGNVSAKTFAAVIAKNPTKPLDFHRRLNAVTEFQKLSAAENLAAANKRVQNLLEKTAGFKQGASPEINSNLFAAEAEKTLYLAIQAQEQKIAPLLENADYTGILQSLSTLQTPVDNFFTNVMVMVEDIALRDNRLNLLQRLRNLFLQVADVSLL